MIKRTSTASCRHSDDDDDDGEVPHYTYTLFRGDGGTEGSDRYLLKLLVLVVGSR